ncbi:MAG: GPW/gp25 family protein [Lachnospiraceae bacterium]|nr:GPW/gp25 family protein [Lachnospiraceae bacterium]
MADQSFLGAGTKFPFSVNTATGRIEMSEGPQSVKESVFLILKTTIGERVFRRDYGTTLSDFTFMDTNLTTFTMVKRQLINQIMDNEPRIGGITIDTDTSVEGTVLFNIQYTLRETNTTDNLVFPFYLNVTPDNESDNESFIENSDVFIPGEINDDIGED